MEITKVDNGFIVKGDEFKEDPHPVNISVFQYKDGGDVGVLEAAQEMLWFIIDHFGLGGNRYDEKRLVVKFEKGDKYEG